jgi:hypothetical protein
MWKRGYGEVIGAPPDERGGNRHTQPTATAPHPLERDEFRPATADWQAYWLCGECDCRVNAEDDEFEVPVLKCLYWLKRGIPQTRKLQIDDDGLTGN